MTASGRGQRREVDSKAGPVDSGTRRKDQGPEARGRFTVGESDKVPGLAATAVRSGIGSGRGVGSLVHFKLKCVRRPEKRSETQSNERFGFARVCEA